MKRYVVEIDFEGGSCHGGPGEDRRRVVGLEYLERVSTDGEHHPSQLGFVVAFCVEMRVYARITDASYMDCIEGNGKACGVLGKTKLGSHESIIVFMGKLAAISQSGGDSRWAQLNTRFVWMMEELDC
jgi:hypothetical protein